MSTTIAQQIDEARFASMQDQISAWIAQRPAAKTVEQIANEYGVDPAFIQSLWREGKDPAEEMPYLRRLIEGARR